jgi:hypothetical protein
MPKTSDNKSEMTTDKIIDAIREHFEANMIDWQDIDDCWKAMINAKHVLEYIQEFYDLKSLHSELAKSDKIIDIWCIIDSIEPFILEKHYEDVLEILEKHLHQEPEKEWREWICKVCWKEWMYLETDNMMCDSCWGKPSKKVWWMLQPWEYMRDNEWNITTYEDEQKLSG